MKSYDVVALGELLIDFTENGLSSQGNPVLEANPGGAVTNVLAMLGKLGKKTGFIGKVGIDQFGDQLEKAAKKAGMDTSGLKRDPEVHTTLAFVHTGEGGERSFSFYRNPGADMMLSEEDLDVDLLANCRIFHHGTLSMTHEGCRKATVKAIEIAKKTGALISFDPNLREPLWNSLDEAKEQILYGISQCDILKISDNEITWLTGKDDYDEGVEWIRQRSHAYLIFVSLGKEGSLAYYKDSKVFVPAFVREDTIETTGAGDTFFGCALNAILDHGAGEWSDEQLKELLTFANAAASIITTRKGALLVMPERSEIEQMLS